MSGEKMTILFFIFMLTYEMCTHKHLWRSWTHSNEVNIASHSILMLLASDRWTEPMIVRCWLNIITVCRKYNTIKHVQRTSGMVICRSCLLLHDCVTNKCDRFVSRFVALCLHYLRQNMSINGWCMIVSFAGFPLTPSILSATIITTPLGGSFLLSIQPLCHISSSDSWTAVVVCRRFHFLGESAIKLFVESIGLTW